MSALDLLMGLTDQVGVWGEHATPLQVADGEAVLNLNGPRRHWIGRAKGYSKTRDVGALSVVALLEQFPPGAAGYCAASDSDQATLIRQSIGEFVTNTSGLADLVTVDARKVTVRATGAELVILAADSAGSHGLRPYWLVVDELANWKDVPSYREFFDVLWAGLPKVSDSRGVVISTAGTPSHFSRRIYDAAQVEPSWRVSNVEGPPPWADPAEIEAERRRLLPSVFARLWQNEWVAPEDAIADPDDVDAACILDGPLAPEAGQRYVCTLDIGTRHDRTAAVIAHAERSTTGTRVIVDRLEVWTPRKLHPVKLDEVRLWLVEMCHSYKATLVYDPSQAYLLAEQIRQAHIPTREFLFTATSVGKLATDLMQSLRGRMLTLPNDEALREEILSVRLRESSPNVLRIDHRSGGHDDRVIAVAMACSELGHQPAGQGAVFMEIWRKQLGAGAELEDEHECADTDCPGEAAFTREGSSDLFQCPKCSLYERRP